MVKMFHHKKPGLFPPYTPETENNDKCGAAIAALKENLDSMRAENKEFHEKIESECAHIESNNTSFKNQFMEMFETFRTGAATEMQAFKRSVDDAFVLRDVFIVEFYVDSSINKIKVDKTFDEILAAAEVRKVIGIHYMMEGYVNQFELTEISADQLRFVRVDHSATPSGKQSVKCHAYIVDRESIVTSYNSTVLTSDTLTKALIKNSLGYTPADVEEVKKLSDVFVVQFYMDSSINKIKADKTFDEILAAAEVRKVIGIYKMTSGMIYQFELTEYDTHHLRFARIDHTSGTNVYLYCHAFIVDTESIVTAHNTLILTSNSLTANMVKNALGYTPADATKVDELDEGTYDLIESITTTESITKIERTVYPDGGQMSLKSILIGLDVPATGEGYYAVNFLIYTADGAIPRAYLEKVIGVYRQQMSIAYYNRCGYWHCDGFLPATGYANLGAAFTINPTSMIELAYKPINRIVIYAEKAFPVGTKIIIWGVKANA